MGKLDGKHVVVTGASRGIGQAIAELFAREGGRVVCAARTLNEGDHMLEGSLSRTVQNIKDAGGEATAVTCDISEEEGCEQLLDAARAAYGPVDILVNNAALNYYIPIADYQTNRWIRCFKINVHAPFILSRNVLPDMKAKSGDGAAGHCAIVNISSGAAIGPGRGPYEGVLRHGGTMYGATKAALERFTQGLAEEVAELGNIAVTAVSPSRVVPTPGTVHHKLVDSMDDPKGEPPSMMANASLLLATEPVEKVNGRVTYSQMILGEFGWIENPVGRGIDSRGSGYSEI
ncbi:MAG: SDR family NAD(P)-dependent oxidoreductase [Rickettsiales bacterium]